jgi:hypothetical protein
MTTISILVDPEIQAAFDQATDGERQALSQLVTVFLKEGWAHKNLIEVMKEIANRADQRGLTSEVLDDLLADE